MRLLALISAFTLPAMLAAAPVPKEKPKKGDEEAILGTWKVAKVDLGVEGVPLPGGLDRVRVTFERGGKVVTTDADGKTIEGTYKLDPSSTPKGLDISGQGKAVQLGVYELEGDTLTLASPGEGGASRPTEVKANGKGVIVLTLKRVVDEKKDK